MGEIIIAIIVFIVVCALVAAAYGAAQAFYEEKYKFTITPGLVVTSLALAALILPPMFDDRWARNPNGMVIFISLATLAVNLAINIKCTSFPADVAASAIQSGLALFFIGIVAIWIFTMFLGTQERRKEWWE